MDVKTPLPDHDKFVEKSVRRFRTFLAVTLARLLGARDEKVVRTVYYHDNPLIILPTVFDPMRHWSGELLADNLAVEQDDVVLDMG
ncbi:hypothetical protein J7M28_12670, partial [bacterium]|nr:hypothetical protein [bacterium]